MYMAIAELDLITINPFQEAENWRPAVLKKLRELASNPKSQIEHQITKRMLAPRVQGLIDMANGDVEPWQTIFLNCQRSLVGDLMVIGWEPRTTEVISCLKLNTYYCEPTQISLDDLNNICRVNRDEPATEGRDQFKNLDAPIDPENIFVYGLGMKITRCLTDSRNYDIKLELIEDLIKSYSTSSHLIALPSQT